MERRPVSGELYRHFKNRLYQIITIAVHTETGEELVIYQALYGDYRVCARPLAMFLEETDRTKYPEATQKYRFEKVERTEKDMKLPEDGQTEERGMPQAGQEAGEYRSEEKEVLQEGVSPRLMAFFDADDLDEKYSILLTMREEITDHLINNMAVVLDVVIPEGDVESRYEELKRCIRTKQRYESDRLR